MCICIVIFSCVRLCICIYTYIVLVDVIVLPGPGNHPLARNTMPFTIELFKTLLWLSYMTTIQSLTVSAGLQDVNIYIDFVAC